jgi:hypothetical protein
MGAAFVSRVTYCRVCRGPRDRCLLRKKPKRRTNSRRIESSETDGSCAGWLVSATAEGMQASSAITISAHAAIDRASLGNCISLFRSESVDRLSSTHAAVCRKSADLSRACSCRKVQRVSLRTASAKGLCRPVRSIPPPNWGYPEALFYLT